MGKSLALHCDGCPCPLTFSSEHPFSIQIIAREHNKYIVQIRNKIKNEYISKGVSQNCSTALNKHLCECQARLYIGITVRDMTVIFSSTCRSSRGGTQTAHKIFIRPLVFSVDGFEVDTF